MLIVSLAPCVILHKTDGEAYYFLLVRTEPLHATTETARGKRMIGQAI
jgi:hypothetical protein